MIAPKMPNSRYRPTEIERHIAATLARMIRERGYSVRRFTLEVLGRQNEDWVQRRIRGAAGISIAFLEEVANGLETDATSLLRSLLPADLADESPCSPNDAGLLLERMTVKPVGRGQNPYSRYLSKEYQCRTSGNRKTRRQPLDSDSIQAIETETFVSPESALQKAAFALETYSETQSESDFIATLGLIGSIQLRLRRPDHGLAKHLLLKAIKLNEACSSSSVNAYLIEKTARLLFATGKVRHAQDILSAELAPNHPLPHNFFALRAILFHYSNQPDDALANLDISMRLMSHLDEPWPPGLVLCGVDLKARIHAARGRLDLAFDLLDVSEEFLSRLPPLLREQFEWLRAQIFLTAGRKEEAKGILLDLFGTSLLATDPQHRANILLDLSESECQVPKSDAHLCIAALDTDLPIEAGLYNELVRIYGAPASYRMRAATV